MKLLVVESPTKIKTVKKFLPKGYNIIATYGHIKDLPKNELGVDLNNGFEPKYVISSGKRKVVTNLKKEFYQADTLIIAVDPDREGEAIGWHVAQILGLINKNGNKKRSASKELKRIVFHEITKSAIQKALESPRAINMDLVNAQQARRILDRLVGYKLSPLLWKKIRYGLSAGRVQSVAVRLIVEREREREKFKAEEYWSLEVDAYEKKKNSPPYPIEIITKKDNTEPLSKERNTKQDDSILKLVLTKKDDKKVKPNTKESIKIIHSEVKNDPHTIKSLVTKDSKRHPKPPFTTSTLQQTAFFKFGYGAKRTMQLAQKLYERGLITYMRTDSFHLSRKSVNEIRSHIEKNYGKEYVPQKPRIYRTKSKLAQEAHEAIRPTNIKKIPQTLKFTGQEKKLYDLIWKRTAASQMSSAKLLNKKLVTEVKKYTFEAKGAEIKFNGFLKVYPEKIAENIIPDLKVGDKLYPRQYTGIQHFTSPPARFTEATLIKELEKNGIGRPSTYAPTITTITSRGYITREQRYLIPTDNGIVVNDLLVEHFPNIVDLSFTAQIEDDLDKIAKGKEDWRKFIKNFYTPFEKNLLKKDKVIKKEDVVKLEKSNEKCPECGKKMIVKLGRYGKFLSCSNFPKCKGMKALEEQPLESSNSKKFKEKYEDPPLASDGKRMILKRGKFGKYWAHPDYPKPKESAPLLLKEKCPECKSNLVERMGKWNKTFIGCSAYPKCKYIKKQKKGKKSKR